MRLTRVTLLVAGSAVGSKQSVISRDWSCRISNPSNAAAIHATRDELHSFFIQPYNIENALRDDAANTGVPDHQVEAAINASPALALIADLANLDKHGDLRKRPRSGDEPRVGAPSLFKH